MDVRILVVPYDSGHRAVRMGRGPQRLIESGLEDAIRAAGHDPRVVGIECGIEPPTEIAVAFDLLGSVATGVRSAREEGAFPLVLAGNCFNAIGIVAGLGAARTGVLWFDAHGDLNTPETTRSGFLDGMAAATLTGRCWETLAAAVPGYAPLADERLMFIGARDLDPAEESLIRGSAIRWIGGDGMGAAPGPADMTGGVRDGLAAVPRVDGYYLHVDLDVLDPAVARANGYAAAGGLTVEDVVAAAGAAAGTAPLAAAAVTAFDPAYDPDGRSAAAATAIVIGILGHVSAT